MAGLALRLHGGAHGGAGVHHLVVLAAALGVGTPAATRILRFEAQVAAARAELRAVEVLRAGGDCRVPVERDRPRATPDAHFVARARAVLAQRVFDAQLGQAVGQIAHGLVVVEVRLHDPPLGLRARHREPVVAVAVLFALDLELLHAGIAAVAAALARLVERIDDDALLFHGLFARGDVRTHLRDEVREREVEFLEPFVRRGGDDVHRQVELFELRLDELGELLRFGHIDLVEDDDARAFGDRDRAERKLKVIRVFTEFLFERVIVAQRVAARFERGAIDHVRDDLGALDVTQELQAEAFALRGARDQARHVGDRIAHVAGLHHAQVRHERGERVVGDLRLGGAHRGDQA